MEYLAQFFHPYLLYCNSPRFFFVFFTFRCDGAEVDPAAGCVLFLLLLLLLLFFVFLSSSEEQTEMALSVSVTPLPWLLPWLQGVAVGSWKLPGVFW